MLVRCRLRAHSYNNKEVADIPDHGGRQQGAPLQVCYGIIFCEERHQNTKNEKEMLADFLDF